MRTNGRLILASASPRRFALLKDLGIVFEVVPSGIGEDIKDGESPQKYTSRVAREKALDVLSKLDSPAGAWIVSADTTVLCQGKILNKPSDCEDAKRMISLMSGKTHKVVTSFCILEGSTKKDKIEVVESYVTFRNISGHEIDWYVGTGEPLDKAGAYGAQGYGTVFIDRIEGSYTNVVGLPISQLVSSLINMGVLIF